MKSGNPPVGSKKLKPLKKRQYHLKKGYGLPPKASTNLLSDFHTSNIDINECPIKKGDYITFRNGKENLLRHFLKPRKVEYARPCKDKGSGGFIIGVHQKEGLQNTFYLCDVIDYNLKRHDK